jgi:hypothetical protein
MFKLFRAFPIMLLLSAMAWVVPARAATVIACQDSNGSDWPASTAHPCPTTVPTWAGGTLGAMATYGTSPGAVLVPGVNAYVTNSVTSVTSGAITNPTTTLTLPSATTAYTAGNLIANSGTAGSVVVPSFAIGNSAGGAIIPRLRLSSNDATSTAWGSATIQVDLWSAAPTFTNGDRAAWLTATGSGGHINSYTCSMSAVQGDGVFGECNAISPPLIKLAAGTSVFVTLQAVTASGVTGASKVFTVIAEVLN